MDLTCEASEIGRWKIRKRRKVRVSIIQQRIVFIAMVLVELAVGFIHRSLRVFDFKLL